MDNTKKALPRDDQGRTLMQARYKGYCATCHHTIWAGERITYNGQARHLDCIKALTDPTPRVMDKRYEAILGKVKKTKLRQMV